MSDSRVHGLFPDKLREKERWGERRDTLTAVARGVEAEGRGRGQIVKHTMHFISVSIWDGYQKVVR